MRISSGTHSVQFLQARQAFQAAQARPPQPEASDPQTPQPNEAPVLRDDLQRLNTQPQWQQTFQEIRGIAEQAGYVGLSETAVQRAYLTGESLLADYKA